MPTIDKLDSAYAHAQALHAALTTFALETLDPCAKAMWTSLSLSAQDMTYSIGERRQQLLSRQAAISEAQHASVPTSL